MSGTMRLTDDAIRAALTPAPTLHAPAGLADAIRASIDATPQRRAGILGRTWSPRTRRLMEVAAVGLLLLGLVIGALVAGSRLAKPPSVPTYHGGTERTGVMPGPGPGATSQVTWEESARGPFGAFSPAVVGGKVYASDQRGFVTAFDQQSGAQRWQVEVGSPANSGITFADGLLLVGDDDGVLHALDAATGNETWQFRASGPMHGSAAVVDGVAYFGTTDGHLYALDMSTQELRWPVTQTPGSISRTIAVGDGIVYAGSGGATPVDSGSLGAYDATTGDLRWSAELEPGNTSTPSIAGGRVFVAGGLDATTGDHGVFAFDATSGSPAWPTPFAAPANETLLLGAVTPTVVYVTGTDGMLYALDAATGALDWTAPIQSTRSPNAGLVGQTLYVTSDDNRVHAIDVDTHGELWSVPVTGTPGAPAVIDGAIFVTTTSGKVVRIGGSDEAAGTVASP
jgi:outer membrane protein assembly factor BamB